MSTAGRPANERAERIERRLEIPVLSAAAASVPAVFLLMLDGVAAAVGTVLNWLSLVVLNGEAALLPLLARDRRAWLWQHKWPILIAAAAIPAVILAIGPLQVLRLVTFLSAWRIMRAGRFFKAGRVLVRRTNLGTLGRRLVLATAGVLATGFVVAVLADPSSRARQLVDFMIGRYGLPITLLAGLAVAGLALAGFAVARFPQLRATLTHLPHHWWQQRHRLWRRRPHADPPTQEDG